MLESFFALAPWTQAVLLTVLAILGVGATLLVRRALAEGREVSFWPPRIGQRPSEPGAAFPPPGQGASQPHAEQISEVPSVRTGGSQVPSGKKSFLVSGIDTRLLAPLKEIGRTKHSLVEICRHPGGLVVRKP